MKTTNLFKAVAFVAMVIVSIMNSEVKARTDSLPMRKYRNDLIVAKPSSDKAELTSTTTCVMNLHTMTKTA